MSIQQQQANERQSLVKGSSQVLLWPRCFLSEADDWYHSLTVDTPWRQEIITLYGKQHPIPRQQAWHGNRECHYSYSGLKLNPQPWTPLLQTVRDAVETRSKSRFNAVLLNRYRDGNDRMGWHSDNEPELGRDPVIAIVSLGAERELLLRKKHGHERLAVPLPHGSLLVMAGRCQHEWQHAIPVRKKVDKPRVSLTFRFIHHE